MAERRSSRKSRPQTTGQSAGAEISRREFLKVTGALAAGGAIAGSLADVARAKTSQPSPPADTTPTAEKPIRMRFTERARRVVFFAQEEAKRLDAHYVGTEHLLLGLVREDNHVAARILDRLSVPLGRIRSDIERQVTRGHGNLGQDMQLTPRAKWVIDLASEEARQLNNDYLGTEHLLLGLIREGKGLAARVLVKSGADLERTRREVEAMQETGPARPRLHPIG